MRDACCPCGYSLAALNTDRCPECGRGITDLLRTADLHPERLPEARRRAFLRLILRGAGVCAGVVIAGFGLALLLVYPREILDFFLLLQV